MITIDEIAKIAGVSKTSVSFALNDKPGISQETKNRIIKIARQEGYLKPIDPNLSNKNILLVMCSRSSITTLDSSSAPFYSELIRAVEKNANDAGYNLLLKSLELKKNKEVGHELASLVSNSAGTILIATDIFEQDASVFMDLCDNIVLLDSFFSTLNINCVVMDNYMGGYKAGKHLIELGHEDIGYIGSKHRIYNFDSRKRGFFDAMRDSEIQIHQQNIYEVTPSIDETRAQLMEILKKTKLPTAFFAENDYIAIGLLQSLDALGIRAPEEISVIGFDDIEIASFIQPKLTTIKVFKDYMAYIAVKKIASVIEQKKEFPSKEIVTVELIQRESCKEK